MRIRMHNNKKGTAVVEAALVLPLIITVVMVVFYLAIAFYMETANSASLHLSIRSEAIDLADTGTLNSGASELKPSDIYGRHAYNEQKFTKICRGLFFDSIQGSSQTQTKLPRIFNRKISMGTDTTFYIIKETEYIRCLDIIPKQDHHPYS